MKLTYIYHSGFIIEGEHFAIVIDYYKDSTDIPQKGIVHEELLKTRKKLYVLNTHSHHDHFNKKILRWKWEHPEVIYIFSKDILKYRKAKERDAIYIDKSQSYQDNTLYIKAYGSTDLGVSFLIKAEGKVIFHAGDLNNWHWNEESTKEEIEEAETFYSNELNLIASEVKHIDLVMYPIDPRLGKDYIKGAQQFVDTIPTSVFAPMHFGEEYKKASDFAEYAKQKNIRFLDITHKGQSFEF
ncbi:MAG: MBL fold metallo-hydrolase [Prevotella sp.]|jgi:L-ascorbate metabolism protein UlaG (beta-lactamase superfamily)|nr:MBL fold metallo-hydrolase [Prevotella sp.]